MIELAESWFHHYVSFRVEKEETIYQFADPIDYLKFTFEQKRVKNHRFSLRAWARQLGYDNPSFLSHILHGRRKINKDLCHKISHNLSLSANGRLYFEFLILLKNSRSEEERKLYQEALEDLKNRSSLDPAEALDLDVFQMISEWHHVALLEMIKLGDFRKDFVYLSKRLGGEVSPEALKEAWDRLERLNLIFVTQDGKVQRKQNKAVVPNSKVPSNAIRYFHSQMISKAKEAIEKQNIKERDLRSSTVAIPLSNFEKAQEILQKAHQDILKLGVDFGAEEVYQVNTQFFRITERMGQL